VAPENAINHGQVKAIPGIDNIFQVVASQGAPASMPWDDIATFGWFYFGWLMPLDPAP